MNQQQTNKKTHRSIHVYANEEIRSKLAALAKAHKRSMSSELQALIDEAFQKFFTSRGTEQC